MSGYENVHLHLFHLGDPWYQQCASAVIEMPVFYIAVFTAGCGEGRMGFSIRWSHLYLFIISKCMMG